MAFSIVWFGSYGFRLATAGCRVRFGVLFLGGAGGLLLWGGFLMATLALPDQPGRLWLLLSHPVGLAGLAGYLWSFFLLGMALRCWWEGCGERMCLSR